MERISKTLDLGLRRIRFVDFRRRGVMCTVQVFKAFTTGVGEKLGLRMEIPSWTSFRSY
jgi:hypothetical protein